MAELDAVVHEPAGPAGGLYDNALFSRGRGRVLVHLPVDAPVPAVGRVRTVELPAADLALTVQAGPHDTIEVTYGELGRWVADHALAVAGPVREAYFTGPRDTPAAADWRTEIGWPMFRVTDALHAPVRTRGGQVDGVIPHSDHGAQYGSKAFADACRQARIRRSMGAVGTSADNAAAESFIASLKREILPGRRGWPTERAARLEVLRWLGFCNNRRRRSTIGYLAPVVEQRSTRPAIAA